MWAKFEIQIPSINMNLFRVECVYESRWVNLIDPKSFPLELTSNVYGRMPRGNTLNPKIFLHPIVGVRAAQQL